MIAEYTLEKYYISLPMSCGNEVPLRCLTMPWLIVIVLPSEFGRIMLENLALPSS